MKNYSSFLSGIRAAIRGYWNGQFDRSSFFDAMVTTIDRRLNEAFDRIAKEYGIDRNEFTEEEVAWIDSIVNEQFTYITNLADAISENSRSSGGKLGPLIGRAELWANVWNRVQSQARTFFARNGKLEWVRGPTGKGCRSCVTLNGKVKRASYWRDLERAGVYPQSRSLRCGGHKCLCRLEDTNKPISPGPLPRV